MNESPKEVSSKSEKKILKNSIISDTIKDVQIKFKQYKLIQDETFFDYELLKAALHRKEKLIVNFLLDLGCRVRNPSKIKMEETPLHLAIQLGDSKIIKEILKKGASICDKNKTGKTAIQAGYEEGHHDAVNQALNFFFINNRKNPVDTKNPDPKDEDDVLHFHIAFILNNLFVVDNFSKYGFDVNHPFTLSSREFSGLNPLHYAIKKKNSKMITFLLKHGADLSIRNSDGQTPLHISYYSGCSGLHIIASAFNYGNESKFINSIDSNGVSHFHMCCIEKNPDAVKVFIDKGVDVNSAISLNCSLYPGFTPLHFAAMHNDHAVVELLLKNGADCNKTDAKGNTPLHLACEKAICEKIIQTLLDYGASPAAADQKGCTPMHIAFYKKLYLTAENTFDRMISKIPRNMNFTDEQGLSHFHIVCTRGDIPAHKNRVTDFLESGVAVDSCIVSGLYSGYTALHFAVLFTQNFTAKLLLEKNAQVNVKTSENQLTPLHLACKYCRYEISKFEDQLDLIKLLLQYRANINAKTKDSETPLQIFIENTFMDQSSNNLSDILSVLLENGSDINARNKYGSTILQIALKNHLIFVIEELLHHGADMSIENLSEDFTKPSRKRYSCCTLAPRRDNVNYVERYQIIFIHVQKRLALGQYVDEKVIKGCIKFRQRYQTELSYLNNSRFNLLDKKKLINLDDVFDNCIKELERMKLVKIDNYTSLYSILLKNPHELSKHVKNGNLIKILEDPDTKKNFPFYGSFLKVAFKKGLIRNALLESSNTSLSSLIGLNLPEPCHDSIMKYLTNEEIANLKSAALKISFKRKVNDGNSNEIQPSAKLQKKN